MHLTIDNQDYTAALDTSNAVTIERALNAPSTCRLSLALPQDGSLAAPSRLQSLAVSGDDGTVYFTGYIAAAPVPEYAGFAMQGARYRLAVHAVSDEMLLDLALASSSQGASGTTAGRLLGILATRTGNPALDNSSLELNAPVGHFTSEAGAPFSKSAGQVADQARAVYRAQAGRLTLNTIPAAVHPLSEQDGSLALANLSFTRSPRRNFANDITVCGDHEPATYVTEVFEGDGANLNFDLSGAPWFPPASKCTLISEGFDGPVIDPRVWSNASTAYFGLGSAGLAMCGGSGVDGQTQLIWIDPVEMAGTLLLEARGVSLANDSTGLLAAFFDGDGTVSSCVLGFQATAQQSTGTVSLQPIVAGCAAGAGFTINPANQYTLRIRVHSPEQQRTGATFRSFGDSGPVSTGGRIVLSPAKLLFEIQEFINGVACMPVTLYDGAISNLSSSCIVVAASSLNLRGSMRAFSLTSLGSAWVVSAPQSGALMTRRLGSSTESAECDVSRSGRLTFYPGFAPAAGEQITVTYRTSARSVGRAVNETSLEALKPLGSPGTASWIGSVTNPACRTSIDCRNAAAALMQSAGSSSALWSGVWRGTNHDLATDIWPGDALALNAPSCSLNAELVVRSVKVTYRSSVPDVFAYEVAFANDWAEDLAIRTSESVHADAWLPAPAAANYASNLNALTVTAISGNNVTINTGATAPVGGGFEIRSRDYAFMMDEDPSLVMRGSQANLTFTRQAAADRYYVRIFDEADPPNYSEFSAAVIFHTPLSS
ncbi:hypothetical protein [Occallatibacter riparius]|uniref:Uncharacterized protein n=1 Tax=Occallatibacter riparius TaxID=1002689 RepID=A0A9J7BT04_9BACT|nr:hypothetical protein [Occallatibacter riparius]UWZ86035.1 hypothetical protein MOP44_08830 [Occallatibacter riparius]